MVRRRAMEMTGLSALPARMGVLAPRQASFDLRLVCLFSWLGLFVSCLAGSFLTWWKEPRRGGP